MEKGMVGGAPNYICFTFDDVVHVQNVSWEKVTRKL